MASSVILAAKRSPIGSFMGSLAKVKATDLGAQVLRQCLAESESISKIESIIIGNVLSGGLGQAPARQVTLGAGLNPNVASLTVAKVCGSGLKAVMLADQLIRLGEHQFMVAGGIENMSQVPHALQMRSGIKMGSAGLTDLMIYDGLQDAYSGEHMGVIAEKTAKEFNISREAQDELAALSYQRAQNAINKNYFMNEIVAIENETKRGQKIFVSTDEEPFKGEIDKLSQLRPAFLKEGTITAGNASSLSDGGAMLVLANEETARKQGHKPLAKILAQAESSLPPHEFTLAPHVAILKAVEKAGLKMSQIDLFEINEAFAVVSIVNNQKLDLSTERVNVNGGAIALGHPIGASGARILVTLLHELERRKLRYGCASLCIGGGEGVAIVVERII